MTFLNMCKSVEGDKRGKHPSSLGVAVRARSIFSGIAHRAHQFELRITTFANIFINRHFLLLLKVYPVLEYRSRAPMTMECLAI